MRISCARSARVVTTENQLCHLVVDRNRRAVTHQRLHPCHSRRIERRSPCCVAANSIRAAGRIAFIANVTRAFHPRRPTRHRRPDPPSRPSSSQHIATRIQRMVQPNFRHSMTLRVQIARRTVAPVRFASAASSIPIGPAQSPAPSHRARAASRRPCRASVHRLDKVACSNETPSGIRTVPQRTIQSITRTYSAKRPPEGSNPAVHPTFL